MKISSLAIAFYKRFLSSNKVHSCIYTPTCSMYALDAIDKYGFFRGCFMSARRIARCTPFRRGGYDPVPENYKGNAKWLI